jgi:hypothetical protein
MNIISYDHDQTLLNGCISREDLANELGRSVRTLDRWHQERLGPPRIKIGKLIVYRKTAVLDWLNNNETSSMQMRTGRQKR